MTSNAQKRMKSLTWEENLFLALYRVIQAIKIHQDNNQLVKSCLRQFRETISHKTMEGDLTILISEDRFYIQGERLHHRKQFIRLTHALLEFFKGRGIQGLCFDRAAERAHPDEVLAFFRLLVRSAEQKEPTVWLIQKVDDIQFPWVSIVQETGLKHKSPDDDPRERARVLYFRAMSSVKEVAKKIPSQGYAGIRSVRRMLQGMVDMVVEDEAILLGLATVKAYDDYTFIHSVNVAVLALCLGNRIGLSRSSLEHLGICGLFHDLGKVEIPREIITKPSDLNTGEWKQIQKHPLSSVRQILKLHASHDLKSEILIAPFEHHIRHDLSGYPNIHFKKKISLFGRVLHITDVYDAVTSPRVYRPSALSPHHALRFMLKGAGTDFDPILFKVFATMMGTYPVGTVLELDTGEMGLVVDCPNDLGGIMPTLILLEKGADGDLRGGELVDLAEKNPRTGAYRRNVVRSLNAASLGIQPIDFLV